MFAKILLLMLISYNINQPFNLKQILNCNETTTFIAVVIQIFKAIKSVGFAT